MSMATERVDDDRLRKLPLAEGVVDELLREGQHAQAYDLEAVRHRLVQRECPWRTAGGTPTGPRLGGRAGAEYGCGPVGSSHLRPSALLPAHSVIVSARWWCMITG